MRPGSFDDGDREIPGGVEGEVRRVLVIGAGIAGLTVANALHHAGVACVVLEARQRMGGRLHTVEVGGCAVDLGGSWLHHPSGNPLRRFADEAGIECRPGDPLPGLAAFDVPTGRWLSARVGYADGAMSSGIREAKRLLGVPEVSLGRLPVGGLWEGDPRGPGGGPERSR